MRECPFKRGFQASDERLADVLKNSFDGFEGKDGRHTGRIGDAEFALEIRGKKLVVETINPGEGSAEIMRRYNQFLESLTGYSAKERRKKMIREMSSSPP